MFWIITLAMVFAIALPGGLVLWWTIKKHKGPTLVLATMGIACAIVIFPYCILASPVFLRPIWPQVLVQKCHWEVKP